MSEKVKFSDEELKDLEQLQNDYSQKQVELGQVHVQRLLLNQQMEQLHNSIFKFKVGKNNWLMHSIKSMDLVS